MEGQEQAAARPRSAAEARNNPAGRDSLDNRVGAIETHLREAESQLQSSLQAMFDTVERNMRNLRESVTSQLVSFEERFNA